MLCNEFLNFQAVLFGGPPFFLFARVLAQVSDFFH